MFTVLERAFFGLFLLGMMIFLVGFCTIFKKLFTPSQKVNSKKVMIAGGLVLLSSCIPLIATLFV